MSDNKQQAHTNKYEQHATLRPLRWLLRQPAAGIAIHWAVQGLLYMDVTERRFKVAIDLIMTVAIAAALSQWMDPLGALATAFLLAHTINFLFNGQLWVLLKHYGLMRIELERYQGYMASLRERVRGEASIARAAVYGSLARDAWSPTSDLDVRLIRRAGFLNGLRACWFVALERGRALLARFPLDIYVGDSDALLDRMNTAEEPIDLLAKEMCL
jgi:Nucleotidyltransferase domain